MSDENVAGEAWIWFTHHWWTVTVLGQARESMLIIHILLCALKHTVCCCNQGESHGITVAVNQEVPKLWVVTHW